MKVSTLNVWLNRLLEHESHKLPFDILVPLNLFSWESMEKGLENSVNVRFRGVFT